MFLLDTNVVSEPAKPRPNQNVLRLLDQHTSTAAIASVVWHELWYGVERLPAGKRRTYLQKYLEDVVQPTFVILPYCQKAARWHAAERARLAADGRTPPLADGQVAAIAAVHGLTLVTRNLDDFANFRGLELTDWFESDQHAG